MEFLKRYHREMLETEKVFEKVQEKSLLADKQLSIKKGDQTQAALRGFKTVDTNKLRELETNTLGEWVKQGIMGLVYAHLHSLDAVQRLAATE